MICLGFSFFNFGFKQCLCRSYPHFYNISSEIKEMLIGKSYFPKYNVNII